MYQVNEIFDSIQGEGMCTGIPCTFIRLQGCPVGCSWCDTKGSWPKGKEVDDVEVWDILKQVNHRHVVITGGEPLMQDLDPLIERLQYLGCSIQVETSGFLPWIGEARPGFITCSPKEAVGFEINILDYHELKFVVDDTFKYSTARFLMGLAPLKCTATFMPEGSPPTALSRQRAMDMAIDYSKYGIALYSDRIQYILGVR